MKELKVLAVVIFFTGLVYWGVEPFAHSQMHKHVEGHNFVYDGKSDIEVLNEKAEEAKKALANATDEKAKKAAQEELKKYENKIKDVKAFWAHVEKIAALKGNAANGKNAIAACAGCHGIKAAGMKAPTDALTASQSYGVNPPDLSDAGALYDPKFLAAFILDPAHGGFTKKSAMPAGMGGSDQNIADIIAYLKSIAPKEVTPKQAFESACGRCHAMRYAKWTQVGTIPKTKPDIKTGQDIEALKFKTKVAAYQNNLAKYLGKLPPDLSIIIRARSEHYLATFVENPQAHLFGTAMPRVGVTKEAFEKIKTYLEEVGDSSKPKREAVGPWVLGFMFIFTILAYLWYKSQWKGLK